jgi:hypothetical protein
MALAGGQRVRAHKRSASKGGGGLDDEDEVGSGSDGSEFGITLNEWDDEAPWAPWASLDDPWESVELDCGWVDAPLRELVDRDYIFFGDEDDDEKELDEYDPRRYGKDMLVPTNAPTWTLRAVPTGAFREDGSGGMAGELSAAAKRFDLGAGIFTDRSNFGSYSNAAVDDGDGIDGKDDGPGGVGLAEMLWLLAASGGLRSLKGADTVSRLASAEYWDEVGSNYDESDGFGVADPPRVPPESVLQDVLRDVFDTGGAGRKARKTSGGKDSNTASTGNQSAKTQTRRSRCFPRRARARRRTVCSPGSRCTRCSSGTSARSPCCGNGSSARFGSRTGTAAFLCRGRKTRTKTRKIRETIFPKQRPTYSRAFSTKNCRCSTRAYTGAWLDARRSLRRAGCPPSGPRRSRGW